MRGKGEHTCARVFTFILVEFWDRFYFKAVEVQQQHPTSISSVSTAKNTRRVCIKFRKLKIDLKNRSTFDTNNRKFIGPHEDMLKPFGPTKKLLKHTLYTFVPLLHF